MDYLHEILNFYKEIGATFLEQRQSVPSDPRPVMNEINREIQHCSKCNLHENKKNYVPGEGCLEPMIMFIGEAPGETEDNFGRPFVGSAGQLLDKLIERMGFSRETVFITNIIKCRPPGNRDPLPHEVTACRPYLERQIAVLNPRVIVCLGKVALNNLLGTNYSITKERGKVLNFNGIPVIPTFHPSYILHQKSKEEVSKAKWETWHDMQKVLEIINQ